MSATTATTTIPTGAYAIDPTHSSVGFSIRHAGVSTFRSRFDAVEGKLVAAEDGSLSLAGEVEVDSIAITGNDDLAQHVRTADFLDLANHPRLRFASRELRIEGDRIALAGELAIRGVTRAIEAGGALTGPNTGPSGRAHLGVSLRTVIDRTDFGLDWNMELPSGGQALANEVTIEVELELVSDE